MNWKFLGLRTVLVFLGIWSVLFSGFYLWSVRGFLGFQGSTQVPIQMLEGRIHVNCSFPTPIRAGRTTEVTCAVTAAPLNAANGPTEHVVVAVSIWGDGVTVLGPEHRAEVPNQSEFLMFRIEPTLSGDRKLYIASTVSGITQLTVSSLSVELKPVECLLFGLTLALMLTVLYRSIETTDRVRKETLAQVNARIEKAEIKAESEPTKVKPAWDLARVKLEAYFDRNLSQVNQVFRLAVAMMAVGFAFVLAAITMSLNHPEVTAASKVAAISGIIAQFIGATFLVIYRSTMEQANKFMSVLERINTVGMAVQVLDSIPESNTALKDKTRAEIVALLLNANIPPKGPSSD